MRKIATVLVATAVTLVTLAGPAAATPCKGSLSCVTKTTGSASPTCHTPLGDISGQRCAPRLG